MAKLPHTRSFRFRPHRQLPARPGAPRGDGRAAGGAPTLRRKNILVVEDTATFGGLLVALFKQEGYQAMRAWSAREATKMARDRRPDLVVVELSLPYVEQVELVDVLLAAEETAKKPLLVVTSHTLSCLKDHAQVAAVVQKPFDIDKLLNCVRKALGEPEVEVPEKHYDQADSHLHGW
ncbi:MAG: response regulator [Chloroflexi bacterium]|nr:response regulator [Chloroflexota bacterium]